MGHLDASHETVRALEDLVPEAIVAGGSFAAWLPHPRTLPPADREVTISSAREAAVAHCVRELLLRVGLDEDTTVATAEGGARKWPAGFVGSLTHKGTVVLGVIAPATSTRMIGIDLERTDRDDLAAIENSIASEGLPPGVDSERARLLSFSAKEAVFKAQYPVTGRRLGFPDVQLLWERSGENIRAEVRCPVEGLVIRASVVGRWVVSAAISTVKTMT